jgi:hypothetical protein
MNTLKHSILSIGSSDFTREDYLTYQKNIQKVLGSDAVLIFGDSIATEADQYFVENPNDLEGLWRRMVRLAKAEGKI